MSKYCIMADAETHCTDNCRRCVEEAYRDLKGMAGKAEFVTEEAIKNDLGNGAFEGLREYGFIECCGVIQGKKMYAI